MINVIIVAHCVCIVIPFCRVFEVRFLADLVNTHVIPPLSIMTLFNNFTEVIHESRIPQVCL